MCKLIGLSCSSQKPEAFVTLATNDRYAIGAMVLGCSLRDTRTNKALAVMITSSVSSNVRNQLASIYDRVHEVNVLDSHDQQNLELLARPDLGITFTKLHCWNLTCYSKAVYLDADTLVMSNIDELFEREEFSAAPDVGWPDCFNSGVFVFIPSTTTYQSLLKFAIDNGSFDGGDQGLLNDYFSEWPTKDIKNHLPFIYNTVSSLFYSYAPAFKRFGDKVKIVHFIGENKPWNSTQSSSSNYFLDRWNNVLTNNLVPHLQEKDLIHSTSEDAHNISDALDQLSLAGKLSHVKRQQNWEMGNIDYMGIDAFENIQKKLDKSIETKYQDIKNGINPTITVTKEKSMTKPDTK